MGGALAAAAILALAQTPAYRAPRLPDGKPDLNGIWQTMNEANYDLEGHTARAAMALRPGPYGPVPAAPVLALGAVGAVPPSMGVVEGGAIPYKPAALAQKKDNQEHWLDRDPEIKCYLPGVPRATYMPQPFRDFRKRDPDFHQLPVCGRSPQYLHERSGAGAGRFLDGPIGGALGGRHAGGRRDGFQRLDLV